ncbi:MAG: hypothetical protein KJO07_23650 [Deltaproteobacteria bacterium]|nr:hypothetical protein [Deltaproteobacteria bacterium]
MRIEANVTRASFVVAAVIAVTSIGIEASAGNIKRSCNAYYYATIESITFDNGTGERTVSLPLESLNVGDSNKRFAADAGCGKLVPNRCRKRARNKLLACVKAHARSPKRLPVACKALKSYVGANLVTTTIKPMVCGKLITKGGIRLTDFLTGSYKLKVLLGVSVHGGDDCGVSKPGRTTVDGKSYKMKGNKLFASQYVKSFAITCR